MICGRYHENWDCKTLVAGSKQCIERLEFSLILKKEYEYMYASQSQDGKSTSIGQYQTVFTENHWVGLWQKVVSLFVLWHADLKRNFFPGYPHPRPPNRCKYFVWNENYAS